MKKSLFEFLRLLDSPGLSHQSHGFTGALLGSLGLSWVVLRPPGLSWVVLGSRELSTPVPRHARALLHQGVGCSSGKPNEGCGNTQAH